MRVTTGVPRQPYEECTYCFIHEEAHTNVRFISCDGHQLYERGVDLEVEGVRCLFYLVTILIILVGCKHRASEVLLYIGGRGLVSQIIEPVTFARCVFIIALRNIALDGYLDTRRNI